MGLMKTVGGIVADGASTVFAPAGQCYNVISFPINAYDAHLGRLDYYVQGGMDTKLSKVAAQQLSLFVDICDAALKLRHSAGHKFKTGMKIAFLQENDIQGLLGKMDKLSQTERGLVSAQTFERACASATSAAEGAAYGKHILDKMAYNDAEQKERVEKEGHERTLMDVLAFDVDAESSLRRYHDIRNDFASPPILGVEGTDITGKRYLTSTVVKYLQKEMAAKSPDLRHLVAFFFLDRAGTHQGFDLAAKSLIWQLQNKDVPYMKSAFRICQTATTLDPDEIIPKLLLENVEAERIDARFYLVIDRLGDIMDDAFLKFLRQLSESSNKKIRVFLTGTPAAFVQIKKNSLAYQSVPISGSNQDDINKFIEARIDKFDVLSDTEIENVIKGARLNRSDQVSVEIEKLDRERTPRQIQEINQIILWITFAIEPISVEHLATTLFMNVGEAPMQSLPERFRTKYLLFEVDDNGKVGFELSEALEVIPHRRQLKKSDRLDAKEIQSGEISMIKHFLDKVCPSDMYQKLEIDTYLDQKMTQKQDQVQQEDKDTGHLNMLESIPSSISLRLT
ncbi:hypothetical protein HAV15_012240 [Penicillium sp. str. |nr:hypothetical protein HAV15_012240 [Penicillium sp. str. \